MPLHLGMITMGTDTGPTCPHCRQTLWIYRLAPDVVSYLIARCATCFDEVTIEWNTRADSPETIADVRALHASRFSRSL